MKEIGFPPPKEGAPTKYREHFPELLLSMMKEGKSRVQFCGQVGISEDTFYQFCHTYKQFSEAYKEGLSHSETHWESYIAKNMENKNINYGLVRLYMGTRFRWSEKRDTTVTVNPHEDWLNIINNS